MSCRSGISRGTSIFAPPLRNTSGSLSGVRCAPLARMSHRCRRRSPGSCASLCTCGGGRWRGHSIPPDSSSTPSRSDRALRVVLVHPQLGDVTLNREDIMAIRQFVGFALILWTFAYAPQAGAHGEKSQEPFLRMRTVMWYDVQWSTDQVKIGEEMTITGKFHLFEDWPVSVVPPPTEAWVNVSVPGPQLIRKATYLNGVPLVNTVSLELGRDYEFRLVLQGRSPGRYHLHPMVNVRGGGPIVGPGQWVTVTGDSRSFSNPVTTLTGHTIDLETYGLQRVVGWHLLTLVLAVAWLGFWLVPRPFLGRLLVVEQGAGEGLIFTRDRQVGWAFLLMAVALIVGGYYATEAAYPVTIPLQTARVRIPPLDPSPRVVEAQVVRATYAVTTRTFTMDVRVVNKGRSEERRVGKEGKSRW